MPAGRARVAFVLLVPLLAAACGGSNRSATTATTAPTTSAPPPPTTTAATTTTVPAATTAPAPTAAACATSDLSASVGPAQAGVGHRSTAYVLTNSSGSACRVEGYPGMAFLAADGTVVRDSVARGSGYLFQDPGPKPIVLQPGGSASFSLDWTAANGRTCATSARVEITPPDQAASLTLASQITVCPGDPLTVSALVPGGSGVP